MQALIPRTEIVAAAAAPRGGARPGGRRAAAGLTLVELLVAMALGLFIVTSLVTLYANVTRTNQEMAKTNLLIENGRFAMQLLQEDVQLAGFWGPVEIQPPTDVPNPCLAYANWDPNAAPRAAYINNLMAIPVQGFSNGTPYVGTAPCAPLASVVPRSDVLFVRHASTCVVGPGCDGLGDTGPHIQISGCRSGGVPEPAFVVETTANMDARDPRIRTKACGGNANEAPRRRLVSNVYYVAHNAAGVPTLMRMSYENGTFGAPQPLVEGIEAFKVEYGIDDLGSNGLPISATNPADGNTDRYQTCPPDPAKVPLDPACTAAVLGNAVTVKLHILARNLERTVGHTDSKAYTVGPLTVPAANDAFKRHAFSTTVRLVNPSSRREKP